MRRAAPYLLLGALITALYGNTLQHSFHYDDIPSILEKPWIRGLEQIPNFITNLFIRPVVILTFNLNYAISGFDVWSYHVFNIIAHWMVVILIYRMVLQAEDFLEQWGQKPPAFWSPVPYLAALIFAVHPLNTQSVTYISSRSSILATLFFLATILLFFRGYDSSRQRALEGTASDTPNPFVFYFAAVVCLTLGGLSKEIVITLPAVLFLYHFYFYSGQTFRKWISTAYAPILLVGMPLVIFIVWRLFSEGGVLPTEETRFTGATYFLTQTFVIPFEYFWKMFFPINQSIDIHFPIHSDWADPSSYVGIAALAGWVCFLVWVSARSRLAGFGLAWMMITILPTSSFVPLHDVAVEHRTYLPMVGFALFLGGGLHELGKAAAHWQGRVRWIHAMSLILIICFSVLLVKRNGVWKDEITLWSDAKKKAPHLIRPYNNLGQAYDRRREYGKAVSEFEAALKIDPNYVFALNNLGNIHGKMNNFQKALGYFEKVIALKSDYAPAHYNLARALQALNRPGEALTHYQKAVQLVPYFEQAIYNLALLAMQLGELELAVEHFQKFVGMQPENVRGYFGWGNALTLKGDFDRAIEVFRNGVNADPSYILIQVNLATAQLQSGKVDDALATYRELLKQSPNIAGVHKNLGLIYSRHKNDPDKAIHHFEESLRLEPTQPEAAALLNAIQELQGKSSER